MYENNSFRFYDFTIRVYLAFSIPCQKYIFDNLSQTSWFGLRGLVVIDIFLFKKLYFLN